jgi:glycosyltransferase involved in cell wall biosynthesis
VTRQPLRILQVSTYEQWGGAEAIARNLLRAYRQRGVEAYLAVGRNLSGDPDALLISHEEGRGGWYRFWRGLEQRMSRFDGQAWGSPGLRHLVGRLAEPARILDALRGVECFRFPGTFRLLELLPQSPDIVQAHNLHGEYFDLRALPWLSRRVPLVLTLHDAWLLSGHCGQSFDCDRWKTGCGHCPDLRIYPPVRRDATAYNWERKRAIYAQSQLYVAAPSDWLMRRVEQSILAPAIVEARVIPNGVDLTVFKPADKATAREALGIPQRARALLFVASGIRQNRFKDYRLLRAAAARVAEQFGDADVRLLALGESAEPERIGQVQVQFFPFEPDSAVVAKYYQAADLYLHAARADTFPTTVLEALACGTPVVATAVGGVPEQIKSAQLDGAVPEWPGHELGEATGALIAPGDVEGMARVVATLLERADLRQRMADNAAEDARRRFDLNRQRDAYLEWYGAILARWGQNDLPLPRLRQGVA